MKRGKASDDKRRENMNKRRESDERRENESPVHNANHKETKRCKYCGGKHRFGKRNCPAFGKRCSACGIMNHFASQCMAKANVNVVKRESGSDDEYCLTLESLDKSEILRVHSANDHEFARKLFATISLGNSMVKFQLDSGATCNLLPAKYLEDRNKLTPTRKRLTMYNDTMIEPLGTCKMEVCNPKNARSYHVEFVVVDSDRAVLILGNQTMQQMDLIRVQQHNVMSVNTSQACFTAEQRLKDYPDVFEGTGKLEGQYTLEVIDGATPVVHPPRRVPVVLKGKLKEELDRLQSLGIIEQVTDPTPWVSSLVTVLKPNGQIRVCIDPKDLNRVLRRSHYPTPTIDEILPELSRAKVFSTVDAKNGFWHVEPDDDSSHFTTFNSPFGRFRWLRLPFGLCTAPEEFQQRLNHALEGLKGVRTIHDDILVFGEGSTEDETLVDHDRNLRSLMQRCCEQNVKLNKAKVKLRCEEVPFLGHLITKDGLKADPAKIRAVLEMPTPTDVASVCRFIGFTNYLSKFLPRLSVCEPLRKLALPDVEWFGPTFMTVQSNK